MKKHIKNLFLLPMLSAGFGLIMAGQIKAQTFTTLHNFTAPQAGDFYANSDGDAPMAGLILSGNTLYGTATTGGAYDNGTVFSLNIDGTGFTTIHSTALPMMAPLAIQRVEWFYRAAPFMGR
jgi:uncharacterized repeat protein (TIGR03803 family)